MRVPRRISKITELILETKAMFHELSPAEQKALNEALEIRNEQFRRILNKANAALDRIRRRHT